MVATEGEISVSDILLESLGLLELLREKQSEEKIIEAFSLGGHELYIVKVQRPVYPKEGEWLVYDEECNILVTFEIPPTDDLFLDMETHNTYKRFYWGFKRDDNFSILVDVPCHQERRW